jgi:hypothetical protein
MRPSLKCSALVLCFTVFWGTAAHARAQAQMKPELKHNAAVPHFEITGVVVSSSDGSPIPHCKLAASLEVRGRPGNRRFPAAADSYEADDRGRFSIPVSSAGAWNLKASARGYVSQAYEEHGFFSSSIVLTAESPTVDIRFTISPEASIKGFVLDEAGEPVRDAQVALQLVPAVTPGSPRVAGAARQTARTDDLGMYEFTDLPPGGYRLMAQAHPWYAEASQGGSSATAVDPSLDFAYPLTWFPGNSDVATAETIVLNAGDIRQADFHLVPIPSIHLKITPAPRTADAPNGRQGQVFPIVEEVAPGSLGPRPISLTTHRDAQGQFDISGLTPGLYQVRLSDGKSAMMNVTANSNPTLDFAVPQNDMAKVTIHIDAPAAVAEEFEGRPGTALHVNLIDTDTQRGTFSATGDEGGFAGRRSSRGTTADRTLEVPPGRYEVVLQGGTSVYLVGLNAKGADASGRYVTVPAGETTLTVHVGVGRAHVGGIATIEGKPAVAAMILLVPITIEDPDSIGFLRLDQTNTDGSFDVENVIPGQYILVAIDRGWQIKWGDRLMLRHYLAQGVPMELKSSATVKQNVVAQVP